MRVACVLVTHLRAKVEMGRHRHLEDSPVLIADGDPSKSKTLIVDHFPAACEVRDGMTLEEAITHNANAVCARCRRAVLSSDLPPRSHRFAGGHRPRRGG